MRHGVNLGLGGRHVGFARAFALVEGRARVHRHRRSDPCGRERGDGGAGLERALGLVLGLAAAAGKRARRHRVRRALAATRSASSGRSCAPTTAASNWTGLRSGVTDYLTEVRTVGPDTVIVAGGCVLRRSDNGGATFSRLPWTASDDFLHGGDRIDRLPLGRRWATSSPRPEASSAPPTGARRSRCRRRFPAATRPTSSSSRETTGVALTAGGRDLPHHRLRELLEPRSQPAAPRSTRSTFIDASNGVAVGDGQDASSSRPTAARRGRRRISSGRRTTASCRSTARARAAVRDDHAPRRRPGRPHRRRRLDRDRDHAGELDARTRSPSPSPSRVVGVGAGGATVASDDAGVTYARVGGGIGAVDGARAAALELAGARQRRRRPGPDRADRQRRARLVDRRCPDDGGCIADATFPTRCRRLRARRRRRACSRRRTAARAGRSSTPARRRRRRRSSRPSPQNVLLVGPKSIRRSTDAGGVVLGRHRPRPRSGVALRNVEPAGTALLAVGPTAIRVSADGGASWKKVRLPKKRQARRRELHQREGRVRPRARRPRPADVERRPQVEGVGGDRNLRRATGSASRARRPGTSRLRPARIDPAAPYMLRTTDGGATWQPQIVAAAPVGGLRRRRRLRLPAHRPTAASSPRPRAGRPARRRTDDQAEDGRQGEARREAAGRSRSRERSRRPRAASRSRSGSAIGSGGGARTEIAATDGSFTSAFKLRKPGPVVAQWFGDDDRAGAGSKAVVVKPPKKEPPK